MEGHELLVRHAAKWAEGKRRLLDVDLLTTALDLRSFQDERGDTYWPPGSVDHLLLARWPGHGPAGVPDVERLATSLDTYVHFLRATGRMASGSADPKTLAKEARRAAPRMAAACADTARHSPSKVLTGFAREVGLDLEEAASLEEMQGRLQQVMDAWNALPHDERTSRMTPTNPASGVRAAELNDSLRRLVDSGVDLRSLVDLDLLGDDEDDGDQDDPFDAWGDDLSDEQLAASDPALSAADVRDSYILKECLRLVEWVGAGPRGGRAVTQTGVLKLKEAEAAYVELGLHAWGAGWDAVRDQALGRVALPLMGVPRAEGFWWRSAGDCLPLDRLWFACVVSGLLETGRTRATPGQLVAREDTDWVLIGCMLVLGLIERMRDMVPLDALVHILGTGVISGGPVTLGAVRDEWLRGEGSDGAMLAGFSAEHATWMRATDHACFNQLVYAFDDTGIWRRDGDSVTLTAFGRDVAIVFFAALGSGELEL